MILSAVLEVENIQGVSGKYAALICMGILCTHQFMRLICQVLRLILSCSAAAAAASAVISFYHSVLHPHQ
jgi:hypothetical protein